MTSAYFEHEPAYYQDVDEQFESEESSSAPLQVLPNSHAERPNREPLKPPRPARRRGFLIGGLLLLAGVSIGFLIKHTSPVEDTLVPKTYSPSSPADLVNPSRPSQTDTTDKSNQVDPLATTKSTSEIHAANTPGGAQQTIATEVPRAFADADVRSTDAEAAQAQPMPAIGENAQVSDSEAQVELAGEEDGTGPVNVESIADPVSMHGELAREQPLEQTFLVNFPFDSDDLIPDSHHVLDSTLVMLKANPDSVASITGFADNRGDKQYNLDLSIKRAIAVQQYFVHAGIVQSRLVVEGRGMLTEPVELGDEETTESMQRYRVVQIKVSGGRSQ